LTALTCSGQSFDGYDFYLVSKKDTLYKGVIFCEPKEVDSLVKLHVLNRMSLNKTITIKSRKNKKHKKSSSKTIQL
jgi:hypothetical protein